MKNISFRSVELLPSYLFSKQELNRKITVNAVYDRFVETGKIANFDCDYFEGGDKPKPYFYDESEVAKWMECVSYILDKTDAPDLYDKVEVLIEKIKANQGEDGYFNIYFTVVDPENRFKKRNYHELFCLGHFIEAAIEWAKTTGKRDFLHAMERYVDYVYKVFTQEKSAAFTTPGHEEIELALVKLYNFTGKNKYLELAQFFIDKRGYVEEHAADEYNQSHLPVREQREALGHSVRAVYLYAGMAYLAKASGDVSLMPSLHALYEDIVERKMYITGGIGSTDIGEAFTHAYDLPNDAAYTETCAAIGLILFMSAMLELENKSEYADVIERVLYNGFLSGLSLDGEHFFYENPLEINLKDGFKNRYGTRRLPATQRQKNLGCFCCPPNIVRFLASIGNYIYGIEDETLFVNQYIASNMSEGETSCHMETSYPNSGEIRIKAVGVKKVALRVPSWCNSFNVNKKWTVVDGYAVIENDGDEIVLTLDMTPRIVYANTAVYRNVGRVAVMRGPVVYCVEACDNLENLHSILLPEAPVFKEVYSEQFGLVTLLCEGECLEGSHRLYTDTPPVTRKTEITLIPYNCFANRGECNMAVWLHKK